MAFSETQTRIVTALGLSLFSYVWLFWLPKLVFVALALGLLLLFLYEYQEVIKTQGVKVNSLILFGSSLLGFAALHFYQQGALQSGHLASVFALANPVIYSLILTKDKKRQLQIYLIPLLWFVTPMFVLVQLKITPPMPLGPQLILWMVLVVAVNDVSAYFGGRRFGKTPLAPKISPKKTWEGSFCGLLGGLAVGFVAKPSLFPWATSWEVLWIILVGVPLSQIGDLAESCLKRKYGVKDSGRILPGHGGVLDRFDALLFALPVFGLMIYFFGIGERW